MKVYIEKHLNWDFLKNIEKDWGIPIALEFVEDIRSLPFVVSSNTDKSMSIIMPKEDGVSFVYDYNKHKENTSGYAGGAFSNRFSVIVYGDDSKEVLQLRFVHEFLHSVGKNSDECFKHIPKFLPFIYKILYYMGFKFNCNSPFTQRYFYRWLNESNRN